MAVIIEYTIRGEEGKLSFSLSASSCRNAFYLLPTGLFIVVLRLFSV